MSRAPFCGCDGEEGAWGGDTSPELCPGKGQIPNPSGVTPSYKQGCVTQLHRELENPELQPRALRAGAFWELNLPFFLV